jgi:hypothetical protein
VFVYDISIAGPITGLAQTDAPQIDGGNTARPTSAVTFGTFRTSTYICKRRLSMIDSIWKSMAIGAFALTTASTTALADEHELCGVDLTEANPSAVVSGEVTSVGFMVGVRWGSGTLKLTNGKERDFRILGAKLLETGAAKNVFTGEVYNLEDVNDFEGAYFGASHKISILKSAGEGIVNNSNCVVVKFRMVGMGLQVSGPAPGGVEVSFTD